MRYSNQQRNYNGNNSSYGNQRGYSNGSYGQNNAGNNRPPAKKHSGCKMGYANGDQSAPYVRGWNYSRSNGMVSIIAGPYKGTKTVTSKSGRVWENWCVKVSPKMAKEFLTSGLYDKQTGRVIISSLGIVMNPNKDYCGKFGGKK